MTKFYRKTTPTDTDIDPIDINPVLPPPQLTKPVQKRKITEKSQYLIQYMKRLKSFRDETTLPDSANDSGFKGHNEVSPSSAKIVIIVYQ